MPQMIDRALRQALDAVYQHRRECNLCVETGDVLGASWHHERCALGEVLTANYTALRELREQPSRWGLVNVVARPGLEVAA